jgi:hypothetical protein
MHDALNAAGGGIISNLPSNLLSLALVAMTIAIWHRITRR